jgi:hypothetical protein
MEKDFAALFTICREHRKIPRHKFNDRSQPFIRHHSMPENQLEPVYLSLCAPRHPSRLANFVSAVVFRLSPIKNVFVTAHFFYHASRRLAEGIFLAHSSIVRIRQR